MYTDPRYDMRHTFQFPESSDGSAVATGVPLTTGSLQTVNSFRMPFKARLLKFGVIAAGTETSNCSLACYGASQGNTTFELRTSQGTPLAKFVPANVAVATAIWNLDVGYASGGAPAVATIIPKNKVVVPCLATCASAGSFLYFMDYQEVYAGA